MTHQLKKRILNLVKTGNLAEAVDLAEDSVRNDTKSAECYGLLSHVREIAGDMEAAIVAAGAAIRLAPCEPAYRFQRGRLFLLVDATSDAITDMTRVVALEKSAETHYYTEAADFFRAEALRREHRYDEALAACASVSDDFQVFSGVLLTKESLVTLCTRAMRHARAVAA